MEQKIAPTSPKHHPRSGPKKGSTFSLTPNQNGRSLSVSAGVVYFIISLLGGVLAVLLVLTQSDRLGVSIVQPLETKIIIRDGAEEFERQERFFEALVEEIEPTTLLIYQVPENYESAVDVRSAILQDSSCKGIAFFLTNDGIAVTTSGVIDDTEARYIGINSKGDSQILTDIVTDDISRLAFFRYPGSGFQVVDIADASEKFPLSEILVLEKPAFGLHFSVHKDALQYARSTDKNLADPFLESSESFFSKVDTGRSDQYMNGAPIYKADGSLVGMYDSAGENPGVLYLPERKRLIDRYIENKSVAYPYLGVSGYDLSRLTYLSPELRSFSSQGFLLASSSDASIAAVRADSPADASGLAEGDILTQFDGLSISSGQTLQQLLLTKEIGDIIDIKVLHEGAEKTYSVTLTQLP